MLCRTARRFTSGLLIAALALTVFPVTTQANTADLQKQLREAQEQQAGIASQLEQAYGELNHIEEALDQARAELELAQAEHERLWAEFLNLDAERIKAEEAVRQAEAELAEIEARLAEQTVLLGQRLRMLQENGHVSQLEVLFQSTSFQDFISRWEMFSAITRYDHELLKEVEASRQEAAAKREELLRAQHMARERALLAARRSDEAAERKARIAELEASYEAMKADFLYQIEVLEAESQRIAELIRELEREIARQVGKLSFRYPVDTIRITDNYGPRWHPILNTQRFHHGVDFAVNWGDPIYAVEDGIVIVADYDDIYGYKVIISHGELNGQTVSTLYAHNSELLVSVGQVVSKGQQIARAGSTGWSTGPHSHFEVRINGEPTNPWDGWLPQS